MAIPKRPISGGVNSQSTPPLIHGIPTNAANVTNQEDANKASEPSIELVEDFALPGFDDLDIDTQSDHTETRLPEVILDSTALPDRSSIIDSDDSSTNQGDPKPAKAAVTDELDNMDDEDEEAALDRLLGLLDDDDENVVEVPTDSEEIRSTAQNASEVEESDSNHHEINTPEESVIETFEPINDLEQEADLETEDESEDDDFDEILRQLELDAANQDSSNSISEIENEADIETQDSKISLSESENEDEEDEDDDWQNILASLEDKESSEDDAMEEKVSTDALPQMPDDSDEDDEEEDDSFPMEDDFVPPANPFETLPELSDETKSDEDDDEEEEEEDWKNQPMEDFLPPSDPFANPFEDASDSQDDSQDEDEKEDDESAEDKKPFLGDLKNKASELLSIANIKNSVSDYFAGIKAELHGEEPPAPRSKSLEDSRSEKEALNDLEKQYAELLGDEDKDSADEDEAEENKSAKKQRKNSKSNRGASFKGIGKLFGFLKPLKSLYMGLVNFIFGILTGILGILAKLPLIGFIFKPILGATRILKSFAQYLPLIFLIAGMIAVSYFSVPSESSIELPDSGGATLSNMRYDKETNSISGDVTNTGDVIAEVIPEFSIVTLQPTLNPISWVIPRESVKCVENLDWVDIDSMKTITVDCSGTVTGFIPRPSGVLN